MAKHDYREIVSGASPVVALVLPALMRRMSYPTPAELASFLDSPLGPLQGLTPRRAIELGQAERVLEIASWWLEQG